MKKYILLVLILWVGPLFTLFAQTQLPLPVNSKEKVIRFNTESFENKLSVSNMANGNEIHLNFPLPTGSNQEFVFKDNPISKQGLKTIQTLRGESKNAVMNLTKIDGEGITGIIKTSEGYFFLDLTSKDSLKLISMGNLQSSLQQCGAEQHDIVNEVKEMKGRLANISPFPVGTHLRTYRFAAAATGEFTQYHNNNKAAVLSKIIKVINAANLIYELEASIRFELIQESINHTLIFSDSNTDPFNVNIDFGSANDSQAGFNIMHNSGLLNYSKYDIGHTFNLINSSSARGTGGGTPCQNNSKSLGWTEWNTNWDLNNASYLGVISSVFVHEIGHQFGAWHTYNAIGGSVGNTLFCTSGWSDTHAVEPGSGSTLMGYGNNCSTPVNYVLNGNNSLEYFHSKSLDAIYTKINNVSNCFITTITGNTPPTVSAGPDVYVPKGTPFYLNGTASDVDGPLSSFTWEQFDAATYDDQGALGSEIAGVGGYVATMSTTAPLFRSEQSTSSTGRYFPALSSILNSANNSMPNSGEALPMVARDMKFRFTVRDNDNRGGGVNSDETIVHVVNSGPFLLTSQNLPTTWLYDGTSQATVTWSVNGTNLAPLNVSYVRILLSTDGGNTFPTTLVASTPNTGSVSILIPNVNTNSARLKIEPIGGGVFFDINDAPITITNTCGVLNTNLANVTTLNVAERSESLLIDSKTIGNQISSFSGSLTNTSSLSNLTAPNLSNICLNWQDNRYISFKFYVKESQSLTFSGIPGSLVVNLYKEDFNPTNTCYNFLKSNSYELNNYIYINTEFTHAFTPGEYTLVVSTFSLSSPSLPANFNITLNGTVYETIGVNFYTYGFIAVNTSSNNISLFSENADFRNLNAGSYQIYGLSHALNNPNSIVGLTLNELQNKINSNEICALLSNNNRLINVSDISCNPFYSQIVNHESLKHLQGSEALFLSISNNSPTLNGVSYSYVIIDDFTSKIQSIINSDVLDFRSEVLGKYKIYGISYKELNLSHYLNQNISVLQNHISNQSICARLSSNYKIVEIVSEESLTGDCQNLENYLLSPQLIIANKGELTLNLSPNVLTKKLTNFSGTLTNSLPSSSVVVDNQGSCQNYAGNTIKYMTKEFYVTETTNFSVSNIQFPLIVNLYSDTFNPSNPCQNWISSSGKYINSSNSLYSNLSTTLDTGNYVLVISGFNQTSPSLPFDFSLNISGNAYEKTPFVHSTYSLGYILKNNITGKISEIRNDADLRTTLAGNYSLYSWIYNYAERNSYIGKDFTVLQTALLNGLICGTISDNFYTINISSPCADFLNLSGSQVSGSQKANNYITSEGVLNSGVNINYKAGSYIMMEAQIGQTFEVKEGAIFTAEIGGCD